ncbi:MAG TPA: hypothetical protein VG223_07435 [Solirubrobacteraceae bacterium]|nr:hypothetical protein [Solirubrobacteraceae bacterium]
MNDNYLNSLELNAPNTKLNATETLKDVRDTTGATVQTNIFNPCGLASCPSGPAEVTSCQGVSYGATVWYDFYPQANGVVGIRTSGFDNVIALYQFNARSLVPDTASSQCVHQGDFPSEQLSAKVVKGAAYTFQIGGVVGADGVAATGQLELLFDYLVTKTPRLQANTTLTARATSSGISVIGLSVSSGHRGARVTVSCGRACRSQNRRIPAHGSTTVAFSRLAGVGLPAGTKLQIRVTAPHTIGSFTQYTVQTGNFTKQTRCMEPGSTRPRRTCS